MTTLKPPNVTPPKGSAYAASLAERKHMLTTVVRTVPQPETPETIRVVIRRTTKDEA